jgi:hypothetical protein
MHEAAHATLKQRLLDQMAFCVEYADAPAPAKRRLVSCLFAEAFAEPLVEALSLLFS